jgi:excisionase family DNA binding protein
MEVLANDEGGPMTKRLLRIEAAAEALSISHWTVRLWAKQGRLRTVKLGKLRLVPAAEVERIAKGGSMVPKASERT